MVLEDFLRSVPGAACVLIFRMILASLLICWGIELFNFKKLSPFLTLKRILSLFFLIFGLRIVISSLFFFKFS